MRTKIKIVIETSTDISQENKMEMLTYVRNSLNNLSSNFPEISKVVITKDITHDDLMESLRNEPPQTRGSVEIRVNCLYFDEAQGRHRCTNPIMDSNQCYGVCKNFKDKR